MMAPGEIIGIWVAAGLTLIFFSFIYKDNPLFRFGEHLYVGISVGYHISIQYWNVLIPDVYRPLTVEHNYWVLIPAFLGLLMLTRLFAPISWMSRTTLAVYVGGISGLSIPALISGILLPQLVSTLKPFGFNSGAPDWSWAADVNQLVILVGVFTTLIFFFFSVEHRKAIGGISKLGLLFLMVSFGASFGYTVMARVSLLIGRFQFLIYDWIQGVILQKNV
jgi:hypothetical protein